MLKNVNTHPGRIKVDASHCSCCVLHYFWFWAFTVVKVKVFLCMLWRHVGGWFVTLALMEVCDWPLYSEEWNYGTHWTEGCVGPRAGLAALEKSKISSPYWKLNNIFWVVKLWPSLFTDWAVPTAILQLSCVHVEPIVLAAPNRRGLLLRNLLFPEHNSILTSYSLDLGNTSCLNMVPACENRINIKIVLSCNFSGLRVTELRLVLSENFQNVHHFHVV